jgi:hypothetical protein
MNDPRDTLITTLIQGTKAEAIKWEQANAGATAFIARRDSGTVTIRGGVGPLGIGPLASASIWGGSATLVVKDRAGKTVEEIESPEPLGIGAMLASNPAAELIKLYNLVHEQVTRAELTMRELAREFRKPE